MKSLGVFNINIAIDDTWGMQFVIFYYWNGSWQKKYLWWFMLLKAGIRLTTLAVNYIGTRHKSFSLIKLL